MRDRHKKAHWSQPPTSLHNFRRPRLGDSCSPNLFLVKIGTITAPPLTLKAKSAFPFDFNHHIYNLRQEFVSINISNSFHFNPELFGNPHRESRFSRIFFWKCHFAFLIYDYFNFNFISRKKWTEMCSLFTSPKRCILCIFHWNNLAWRGDIRSELDWWGPMNNLYRSLPGLGRSRTHNPFLLVSELSNCLKGCVSNWTPSRKTWGVHLGP